MKAAISSVRRLGATRSSMIELASSSRAFGSSSASMPASESGCSGSRAVADHERLGLQRAPLACGAGRCGRRTAPAAPPRPARGPGARCRARKSAAHGSFGTWRAPNWTIRISGSPKLSAIISGVKASAQAEQRAVEHRHLDHHAAQPLGRERRRLERGVGAERGAHHDRLLDLEVVEQRDRLLPEGRHRVAGGVARPVGARRGRAGRARPRGCRARPGCGRAARACAG